MKNETIETAKKSSMVILSSVLAQNTELHKDIDDLQTDYDLLKTRTSRSIYYLKNQISWTKAWLGGVTSALLIDIVFNMIGVW